MKKGKTTNITSSFYISPQILKKKNGLTFTYSEWQHKRVVIYDKCKKLNSLKHLVRTTVAGSHN